MPVTLDLPPEAKARLEAEAEAEAVRRGITLDQLVAELSTQFASTGEASAGQALQKFFGCGDSGDPEWATTDIRELRHDMAQRSSEIV